MSDKLTLRQAIRDLRSIFQCQHQTDAIQHLMRIGNALVCLWAIPFALFIQRCRPSVWCYERLHVVQQMMTTVVRAVQVDFSWWTARLPGTDNATVGNLIPVLRLLATYLVRSAQLQRRGSPMLNINIDFF